MQLRILKSLAFFALRQKSVTAQDSTVADQNLTASEPNSIASDQNLTVSEPNLIASDQNLKLGEANSDQNLTVSDQNLTFSDQNLTVSNPCNCSPRTEDTIASVDCQFVLRKFKTDEDKTHPMIVDPVPSRQMGCGSCNLTLTDNSSNGTLRISLEQANDALESIAVNCSGNPGTYALAFSSDQSTPETTLTIAYGTGEVCTG
eukprot:GHVU01088824.1.p1 GENE.GHVU01088824.1~~GHVU01088824.1.p1  ORF type:complete len:203 (+),score=9.55 GHVU01088824.1:128-736(+)